MISERWTCLNPRTYVMDVKTVFTFFCSGKDDGRPFTSNGADLMPAYKSLWGGSGEVWRGEGGAFSRKPLLPPPNLPHPPQRLLTLSNPFRRLYRIKKRSVLERLFLRKKGKQGQGNVHLFFLGSGSASQVIRTSFFRKALSSNRSTRSIGFPPS